MSEWGNELATVAAPQEPHVASACVEFFGFFSKSPFESAYRRGWWLEMCTIYFIAGYNTLNWFPVSQWQNCYKFRCSSNLDMQRKQWVSFLPFKMWAGQGLKENNWCNSTTKTNFICFQYNCMFFWSSLWYYKY